MTGTEHPRLQLSWVKEKAERGIEQWALMPDATKEDINTTRARAYKSVDETVWHYSVFEPSTGVARAHGKAPSRIAALSASEQGVVAYERGGITVRNNRISSVRHWDYQERRR